MDDTRKPPHGERWAHVRFGVIGSLLAAPPEKGALRDMLLHLAAKEWTLKSPDGTIHTVRNLKKFIRDNPALFDEATEILGYDLLTLCLNGPAERLNETDASQPAIFVASLAALESLKATSPEIVAGVTATAGLRKAVMVGSGFSLRRRKRGAWPTLRRCGRSVGRGHLGPPPRGQE